jgi:hypothetical protein
MTKPAPWTRANRAMPSKSETDMATFWQFVKVAVPPFPGMQKTPLMFGERNNDHAKACSRPPFPITIAFTANSYT